MEPYDVLPDDTPPPPGCPAPCPILEDVPDLPYSLAVEDLDGARWVITVEEKERIHRAAHPNIVTRALAGDQAGFEEMRRLHVVRWEHDRGMK